MTFLFMRRRPEKNKEGNIWRRKNILFGGRRRKKEVKEEYIWRRVFF